MSAKGIQVYPQSFEVVFQECKNAAMYSNFKLREEDINRGYIKCKGKSDFRTMYGEKIEIFVERIQNGTQVRIKAKADGPVMSSWGKTDETINKFFNNLNSRLMFQSQTNQTPPNPQAQPQGGGYCTNCGKPLSYIPEYKRWYCYDCQRYQ
jgi:hypothetical protein